jgi:hypothetical protein
LEQFRGTGQKIVTVIRARLPDIPRKTSCEAGGANFHLEICVQKLVQRCEFSTTQLQKSAAEPQEALRQLGGLLNIALDFNSAKDRDVLQESPVPGG